MHEKGVWKKGGEEIRAAKWIKKGGDGIKIQNKSCPFNFIKHFIVI
jgi:hypothetical protein